MNVFNKAFANMAPQVMLKREIARKQLSVLNSGYSHHGASRKKKSLLGWIFDGGSAKEDIEENITVLRERSRDLYMGTPIATGALKTLRTNVVGSGLKLKPQVDYEFLGLSENEASELEATIEREFSLWAETPDCDMARLNNFYELQQLMFLSGLMCGDSFALLPYKSRVGSVYDLRVQLIEADRICDPQSKKQTDDISAGVECDKDGEVIAYHIANFHPLSQTMKKSWTRIEAYGKKTGRRNVIHFMESERIGQRRGVPILAPVIESLKQLGRYTDAELMAAVVSAFFTVFIETENISDTPLGQAVDGSEQVDAEDETSVELGNGAVVALAPGEHANMANPTRPNTAFDGFTTSVCRQIGAALEIPHDLLLKQFDASYSASRAALLEAWKMFKMRRAWLASDFCQPIYEEWFSEAVAKGRIYVPGFFDNPAVKKAYCNAEWCGPSPGQLDPVKEANAAKIRVEQGFSTRTRETIELTGGDFYKNHRQRLKEENLRQELPGRKGVTDEED